MIEIGLEAGAGFTTLRFSGVQTRTDIVCAVDVIINREKCDALRLLCDWSDVSGWTCQTTSLPVYEWVAAAAKVERAVILHHHRWNRQAAWLAALLRYGNAEVRSWHPEDATEAQNWLVASFEKSATS